MSEVPGMGWEATVGGMSWTEGPLKFLPWNVDNLTDWEINPVCFVLSDGTDECATTLALVLYREWLFDSLFLFETRFFI